MTDTTEVPKKQALMVELDPEVMQALRIEAMQRTIEAGAGSPRVSMVQIVREALAVELAKRK